MTRGMPPLALVFGLLVVPFLGLIEVEARDGLRDFPPGTWALGGLLVSCLLRAAFRLPPRGRAASFALVPLALLWSWFFVVDLHEARFGWTLSVVPVAAALGGTTRRWQNVALGALFGLTVVWGWMIPRTNGGCTGVSESYSLVLLLHPFLGLFPAPWLLTGDARSHDDS